MESNQHVVELRVGPPGDPDGRRLGRFLAVQSALAHATARRSFLAHAAAALGVPVWLLGLGAGPFVVRAVALGLYPVLAIGFLVSAVAERWWSIRLQQLEREITLQRTPVHDG